MLLAHKIALDPNAEQRLYFVRAAGTARFAWNWALAEWKHQYKAGERPTEVTSAVECHQARAHGCTTLPKLPRRRRSSNWARLFGPFLSLPELSSQDLNRPFRNLTPGRFPFVNSTPARVSTVSITARLSGSPAYRPTSILLIVFR